MSGCRHMRAFSALAISICLGGWAGDAFAQPAGGTPLPAGALNSLVDPNGINLLYMTHEITLAEVSIGNLTFSRSHYYTESANTYGWRHNYIGTIRIVQDGSDEYYYVSVGGASVVFVDDGGGIDNSDGRGTLEQVSSVWTYTTPGGTVFEFDQTLDSGNQWEAADYSITSRISPTGDRLDYAYNTATCGSETCVRLSSVTSNTGYQLKFSYVSNTGASWDDESDWQTIETVTGINNAYEYCDPTANSCSLTGDWPSVTYANPSTGVYTTTDQDGRVTTFNMGDYYDRIESIRLPGSSVDDLTINYVVPIGVGVESIETPAGEWSYDAYSVEEDHDNDPMTPDIYVSYIDIDGPTGTTTYQGGWSGDPSNPRPRITAIEDPLGRTVTRTFEDEFGLLETETNALGVTTTYTYDSRGNVVSTTVSDNGSPATTYTSTASYPSTCSNPLTCNRPTEVVAVNGVTTEYTYDGDHGGVLTVSRTRDGGSTPEVITTYDYYDGSDGSHPYVTARYMDSASTFTVGDNLIRPKSTTTCTTSANCSSTPGDELITEIGYEDGASDPRNALPVTQTITTSAGGSGPTRVTTTEYDQYSRVIKVDGPLTASADGLANDDDDAVYTAYDADGDWVRVIGPDPDGAGPRLRRGRISHLDDNGRTFKVEEITAETAAGYGVSVEATQTVLFDDASRPIRTTYYDENNTAMARTSRSYNAAGFVECVAQRMNPSVFESLPGSACTPSTTGASGPDRISRSVYNALGQVTATYSGVGSDLEYQSGATTYTSAGQLSTFTDANGNRTTWTYDAFGRPEKVCYPDPDTPNTSSSTDCEETSYDSDGRPDVLTLRDGSTEIEIGYDDWGRVETRLVADDGSGTVNAAGELLFETEYDLMGRVTGESVTRYDSGAITREVGFVYDVLSQLTSTTTQIETGSSPTTLTTAYEYDSAGRRTKITYPGSFDITYDWSLTNLDAINEGASTALISFGYDDRGRRTSLTRETGASDLTTTYDYDPLSRLEEFELSNAGGAYNLSRTFTRNQAGQITGRASNISDFDADAPMTGSLAFDANGLNQVTEQGDAVFDFDAFGNQAERDPDTGTSNDEETWDFDVLNRLIEHQSAPAAAETALVYDALGRLARTTKGSSDYQFVYDGVDLIAEYDGSGGLIRRYVHGPGMDEPLVWYEGSGTANRSYLFADERGSIIGRIDDSGDVMATRTYNEYGAPYDVSVQTGEEPGRFGFTGQAWIADIGAAYYKARFYSPNLGRFLSPDPIGYGDGPNIYAYVGNDPVNGKDPTGLAEVCNELVIVQWLGDQRYGVSEGDDYIELGSIFECIDVPDAPLFWPTRYLQDSLGGGTGSSGPGGQVSVAQTPESACSVSPGQVTLGFRNIRNGIAGQNYIWEIEWRFGQNLGPNDSVIQSITAPDPERRLTSDGSGQFQEAWLGTRNGTMTNIRSGNAYDDQFGVPLTGAGTTTITGIAGLYPGVGRRELVQMGFKAYNPDVFPAFAGSSPLFTRLGHGQLPAPAATCARTLTVTIN